MKESRAYKPAIVIPAFKRDRSLLRLLDTVNKAHYPSNDIDLIISLDDGASEEVIKAAKSFEFKSGQVQVIEHKKKLGLKDHIIYCADYALEFGSVIVLEEDLIVASGYYNYAQSALKYYDGDSKVSGISIYSQRYNETAELPFEPLKTEYSAYFMKLACSWGQAWTAKQWEQFKNWFGEKGVKENLINSSLPENIKRWDDSSWKKFYNAYLIENDKYISYPYDSFSTHTGDEKGEHITSSGFIFQVPLAEENSQQAEYKFSDFQTSSIKYDTHMEICPTYVNKVLKLGTDKILVDLYGTKSMELLNGSKFIITSKKFKNPVQSFSLYFKPLELNLKYNSFLPDRPFFFLYETKKVKNLSFKSPNHLRLAKYLSYQDFYSISTVKKFLKSIFKF